MNYRYAIDETHPHLGGNLKEGDFNTHSPNVWDYLIDRFAIKSVMDLGSGMGYASHYFDKKGCQVIAVDGLWENVRNAVYPTILHDITKSPIVANVDLVHCQEVAEHIDPQYVLYLIKSLACGKFMLFTHALPGQHGYHHVNLQEPDYWLNLFSEHGIAMLPEDTARVRVIADAEGAIYVAQTGMVLVNQNRVI